MSRAYIVSRNGGTVTKAPINDNKIPIYDNESALDADLANIPDNTLVATKGGHDDVIDQMKSYIRNQNVLSDWEAITISTDSNNPTPMPFDGFISLKSYGMGHGSLNACVTANINGEDINVISVYTTGVDNANSGTPLAVKAGDVVYLNVSINSQQDQYQNPQRARWYKLRDYEGR